MRKTKSTLVGPPLIDSWVPYLAGREYRQELYDLFLYDGQIVSAMYPLISESSPREINWMYIGHILPDMIEQGRAPRLEEHCVVPHQYIVAVRIMSDDAIQRHNVIWETGVERHKRMKHAFLYRTTGRRYHMREIYHIAKEIEAAANNAAESKCVLNILKTRFKDVINNKGTLC